MSNQSNSAIVIASVILGASVAGGGWLIGSAVDSASGELSEALSDLTGAVASAPQQVARAAPPTPARGNRPDPNRYYKVSTKGSPSRGESDAKIEVIEFSDFQCPFCARVYPTVKRIEEEYGENVRIVFKHLPLRIHSKAQDAHAAAEAAHRQDKFWEMHDLIFENQRTMSRENYITYAGQIGLDVERFKKDMASGDVRGKLATDSGEAASLGVTGTPAFFVNGRFLSGAQPFESFKRLIDEELKKT